MSQPVFSHSWYSYHVSPSFVTISADSLSAAGHELPRYSRNVSTEACVHCCCGSSFACSSLVVSGTPATFWLAAIFLACSSSVLNCSRVRNSGKCTSQSYLGVRIRVTSSLSTTARSELALSRSTQSCAPPIKNTLLTRACPEAGDARCVSALSTDAKTWTSSELGSLYAWYHSL